MPTRMRLRSPRQPLFLFLGATLMLGTGLGWLGWRLLQQDRDLEDQRTREHLESAAQLLAASCVRASPTSTVAFPASSRCGGSQRAGHRRKKRAPGL